MIERKRKTKQEMINGKIESSFNDIKNSEYIKKLEEDIKHRMLDNHTIRDFFDEIVGHLQSEGCATVDNYTGKYTELMPLFLEHYDDVVRPERLAKYQKVKIRNIMDKLKTDIETSDIKHIRPEVLKMVINYMAPKGVNLDENDGTIKIIYREV